jgi:hypothetical protein
VTKQSIAHAALRLAFIAEQIERDQPGLAIHVVESAETLFRTGHAAGDRAFGQEMGEIARAVVTVAVAIGADPETVTGFVADSS